MGIGASLFLIAIGAILAFGVNTDNIGFLSVDVIGWILMIIGLVGLLLTFYFWSNRRRRVAQVPAHGVDPAEGRVTVREEQVYRDGDVV